MIQIVVWLKLLIRHTVGFGNSMNTYQQFFKGKKITLMGLGLLGRGVGDAEFLARCGAELLVTDIKTEEQLASSLERLNRFENISYSLGGHDLADFENRDLIIKAAGVPLDSQYVTHAQEQDIPVMMDEALFVDIANNLGLDLCIIGVTGTRGKSMTTKLIYDILSHAGLPVHLAGNLRGLATLPLLEKVQKKDYVIMELSSWQLQGFETIQTSPHIAVFTSFMEDHLNYYGTMERYFADKAAIFKYQNEQDHLVVRKEIEEVFETYKNNPVTGKLHVVNSQSIPNNWTFTVPGEHMRANAAAAVQVAYILGVGDSTIKDTLENFAGLEGRLQKLAEINGVTIYNDNNATTPAATEASLKALGTDKKNIILIAGGADKHLPMRELPEMIERYCKHVYLLTGTGTDALAEKLPGDRFTITHSLREAFKEAWDRAKEGDTFLLSPAFSSFNMYANEYERNDEFVELVENLK